MDGHMNTPRNSYHRQALQSLLCTAVLLLACGCATKRAPLWANTAVLDVPYERVWNEVVELNRALSPETTVDPMQGMVQTSYISADKENFPFEQFSHEPGIFHKWGDRRFTTRYDVRKVSEDKTHVSVASQFTAFSTRRERWVVWPSNGKHEESLLSALRGRLENSSGAAAR